MMDYDVGFYHDREYPGGLRMSSLSERLRRLKESGNAPSSGSRDSEAVDSRDTGQSDARQTSTPAPGRSRVDILRRSRRDRSRDNPDADSEPVAGSAGLRRHHRQGPAGASSVRSDSVPPGVGWGAIDDFAWERITSHSLDLPRSFSEPFVLPADIDTSSLLFYDLETTGLSGGAGNTAFLIGVGILKDRLLKVHQLFLADYPGEEALLRRFAEICGKSPMVSYNGRSFDAQVLKTRFLLNRMPPLSSLQIDLLYPSRRLWRGVLENQTLRTLETEVLDFHRTDDLPGSEAPDAWFEWLDGDPWRIEGVFRHNDDDIATLVRLLGKLESWGGVVPGESGTRPSGAIPSSWGLAAQWSGRNGGRERQWLAAGAESGDRRCGMELARRHRREGRYRDARDIWERLSSDGVDYGSAVELAKYWEHRERNPGRALEILDPLSGLPLSDRHRQDLEHRLSRLRRKTGESN